MGPAEKRCGPLCRVAISIPPSIEFYHVLELTYWIFRMKCDIPVTLHGFVPPTQAASMSSTDQGGRKRRALTVIAGGAIAVRGS
jgi:hypothetical protein